jgi:hydrogenase maturation protease
MNNLVVIGVGQTMRGDDAVGVIAVETWRSQYPHTANLPGVQVETAELPGLDLLEILSNADTALIVDAVKSGSPAGGIHILDEQAIAAFEPGTGSAHGWGVAETIRLGYQLGRADFPRKIIIMGIAAQQFEIGSPLSPAIMENLTTIVDEIEKQVRSVIQEQDL